MIKKPIGGEKNGGFRMVPAKKGPKWYPTDDKKKPVPSRKHIHKPTKLRSSITPGTIVILLGGAYRGSRVVYLKQLPSGLLLVTGPFGVNRVPMKRVDQAYVIATGTSIDVDGLDLSKFGDEYFKRPKTRRRRDAMEVEEEKKEEEVPNERVQDQKAIDDVLVPRIEKESLLSGYLKSKFTLKKGDLPHEMKF